MATLIKNKKIGLAKLLSHTSRYIDDICIVNYKHFHDLIKLIYPEDFIEERSGSNDRSIDYLDVKINISNVLHTYVFHKVNDFNFPVILHGAPEHGFTRKIVQTKFQRFPMQFYTQNPNMQK